MPLASLGGWPHPRQERLRALPDCVGRRFSRPLGRRALRLTRGAACFAQQPRRTALNSRVPSPSRKAQDEREVYSAATLCGERGSASDRSGKPPKSAVIPSFPHRGNIFSALPTFPGDFLLHETHGSRTIPSGRMDSEATVPRKGLLLLGTPRTRKVFPHSKRF